MAYETSYDAGLKPFNHNKHRGRWASPIDFLLACMGHAFKIDAVFVIPSLVFQDAGYYALIPYFITMIVCTIPIVFMQSFLGQFSSTGFISVFRIAPLFKGIGYVSLAINITTLAYYSVFAAIPLFFFLHSLRPTLPWSCEGTMQWSELHKNRTMTKWHCNTTNTEFETDRYVALETPSLDFFLNHLNFGSSLRYYQPSVTFSWLLIICSFVIWLIVCVVLNKSTETIGRIIRYSTLTMWTILGICVIRFGFLPGAVSGLRTFFRPIRVDFNALCFTPLLALSTLGPGWGSILTMASYNNFKNNVTRQTWILCLGQFGVMILGSLSWIFIENYIDSSIPLNYSLHPRSREWMQFMTVPTVLSFLEMPHFWSLLYFGMLTLGSTTLLIVQLFSVLTSLLDEFGQLRKMRKYVIRITIGILALGSTIFCSNYGVHTFVLLARFSVATQILLNLMLLLVVLWIYGRERLQRDVHFMTNRTFPTWIVYIVRFIAPVVLLYSCFIGLILAIVETVYTIALFIVVAFLILLPWLLIPGYCIFKVQQTTGLLGRRFRRSVQPTDWYPADSVDRQRYEEAFSSSEVSHQLTTTIGDNT